MGFEELDNSQGHAKSQNKTVPLEHNIYGFVYYNLNVYSPPKIKDLKYFFLIPLQSLRISRNTSPFRDFSHYHAIDNFVYILFLNCISYSVLATRVFCLDGLISCATDAFNRQICIV